MQKHQEHNYLGNHALLLEAWWKYLELLKPFQQMIDETSNLVSQRFGGDNRNFFDDPLVCVKVKGQCLFYGLCSNTTHIVVWKWLKGLEKACLCFKILQKK